MWHAGSYQYDSMSGNSMTDYYTTVQLIAAAIVAIISFPIGLLVPVYFYLKANNGSAAGMGPWEVWGAIIGGIIGIVLVEILGELGGKIAIAIAVLLPILFMLLAVVGTFALGVSGTLAAPVAAVALL